MKIDIYNSERYYDPTPYAALTSILTQEEAALRAAAPGGDGFRPVIYVSALDMCLEIHFLSWSWLFLMLSGALSAASKLKLTSNTNRAAGAILPPF